jgi:hypothetical protein
MFATGNPASHEEAWLALPWLANGRISQGEREKLEPHVRTCATCREELAFQRLLCDVLTEPDRVTYAPGPSFRKLMDRIDGTARQSHRTRENTLASITSVRTRNGNNGLGHVSLWRPPGLAWAASFVLLVGIVGIVGGAYRYATHTNSASPDPGAYGSSLSIYTTTTDSSSPDPNVLHIAFDHSVTIGEAAQALSSAGAHIVEGPDSTGVMGVSLGAGDAGQAAPVRTIEGLHVLAARLRADPRVRWVSGDDSPVDPQTPGSRVP